MHKSNAVALLLLSEHQTYGSLRLPPEGLTAATNTTGGLV